MSILSTAPAPLRRALPFATLLFLLVAAHGLLETARDGLFLTEQPVSRLPWLYLAVTAGILALTPLQRRLWERRSRLALSLTLVAAGGVTLAFWAASSSRVAVLAFYVWTALFSSLVFVQFWLTADDAFQVSEAKRTFGFIAAGGGLGAVVGTGAARLVLVWGHPEVLLLISALLTFGAAALTNATVRLSDETPVAGPELPVARAVPAMVRRDGYLRLLAILALLTAVSATWVDYLFKVAVAAAAGPERIPRLVANVYLGQSVLALLVELVVVRVLLQSTGVTRSLALLPVVVLAGTCGYAVAGSLTVLLLLKVLDAGLRPSLYRVGTELLYLPIGQSERRVTKPSIDTVGQRGGQALASVVLLGIHRLPASAQMGAVTLSLATLAAGWFFATHVLRRRYLHRFQQQLGAGRVGPPRVGELDLASAEALVAALGSHNTWEVRTALEVLAGSDRLRLVPSLILYHPDPDVVTLALELFSRQPRSEVDALLPYLLGHADERVRAAAARRWLHAGLPPDGLRKALADPSPRVRATALVTLSEGDAAPDARERLRQIADGEDLEFGRAVAWAIANAPRADLAPLVHTLLFRWKDTQVRREIRRAVPGLPALPATMVSRIIEYLADPELHDGARDALLRIGEPARVQLEQLLLSSQTPFHIAREIPATLARFPPERAAPSLLERLAQPRGGLDRFRALRALDQLRRTYPRLPLNKDRLGLALERELAAAFRNRALWLTAVQLGVRTDEQAPAGWLLLDLLHDREQLAIERVFRVLDLLFPGDGLQQVYLGSRSSLPGRRDAAREVLLELLPPRWRDRVVALLDEHVIPPGSAPSPGVTPTPEDLVTALLGGSSEMVRMLAPCVAEEEGWVTALPRLRAGPRCTEPEDASVAATAIEHLERRAEQQNA